MVFKVLSTKNIPRPKIFYEMLLLQNIFWRSHFYFWRCHFFFEDVMILNIFIIKPISIITILKYFIWDHNNWIKIITSSKFSSKSKSKRKVLKNKILLNFYKIVFKKPFQPTIPGPNFICVFRQNQKIIALIRQSLGLFLIVHFSSS